MLARLRQIDPFIAFLCTVAAVLIVISFAYPAKAASPNTRGPIVKNPVATVATPAKGWTGIRVGAHGGWAAQIQHATDTSAAIPAFDLTSAAHGFFYGVSVGYDHQLGKHIVWRVSTDYSWANADSTQFADGKPIGGLDVKRMWGVMTGPGLLVTDKALVFAGIGYTTVYSDAFMGQGLLGRTGGLTLGIGAELMASSGFSVSLEYRWADLGNDSVQWDVAAPAKVENDLHLVRAGVNFKFDSPIK